MHMDRGVAWLASLMVVGSLASGCSGCGADPGAGPGKDGPPGGGGGSTSGGGGGGSSSMAPDPATGLEIDPPSLMVSASWGAPQQRTLQAVLVRQSGAREPVMAQWQSDQLAIARVNNAGQVTITAQRAGRATLKAAAEGFSATATVDVTITSERVLPGVATDAPVRFSTATCTPDPVNAPRILYPLNDVVLPLNLPSPLIQWEGTANLHKVTLQGAHSTISIFAQGTTGGAQFPQDLWAVLLAAHAGDSLTLSIESLFDDGTCLLGASQTINLASADLSSTVYYWAVNVGKIVRIDVGATTPVRLNIGPPNTDGSECTACHTLSRDGSRIAFTYYGGSGPGGVVDPLQPQSPIVGPMGGRVWNFAAFDNTGTRLLTNISKSFILRSAVTGDELQSLPLANVAMPNWSPDGAQVAFAGNISNHNGDAPWEIDFQRSDLMVMSFNAATETFGEPQTLVNGQGEALSFPSYSADGSHIVYQRGIHSRSAIDGVGPIGGDLDIVPSTGGTPVRLDVCNPGHNSYMPTFSPFVEGGYQWVAFFSRRDYGHVIRGQQRPQIWVAALDENPQPGVDPSHPPFWLPGQEQDTANLSSYFAPVPCREPGGACTTDVQCCNGQLCRPSAEGGSVCTPPEDACRLAGEECLRDGDCCPGAGACMIGTEGTGICSTGGQACRMANESCSADGECCPGAGSCRADDNGGTVCTPGAPGCKQQGDTCEKDEDCCEGAGFCLEGICGIIGG